MNDKEIMEVTGLSIKTISTYKSYFRRFGCIPLKTSNYIPMNKKENKDWYKIILTYAKKKGFRSTSELHDHIGTKAFINLRKQLQS